MLSRLLPFLFVLAIPHSAIAREITNIPALGTHQRILVIEKSINRQNTIAVYTKLDESCRFKTDKENRDEPVFGLYWLNDGTAFEAFNGFFAELIGSRFTMKPGVGATKQNSFSVLINDLEDMKHDLPQASVEVRSRSTSKGCEVNAFITMGKSSNFAKVRVDTIYVEASGLGGPDAVTITGHDVATQKLIQRRFVRK